MSEKRRIGITAGSGLLPVTLAHRIAADGASPVIIGMEGEAGPDLFAFDFTSLPLERIAYAVPIFRKRGVTHAIFAGGVKQRPKASALRVPVRLWPDLPAVLLALKRGDDGLLGVLVKLMERHGISMIGAHEILPDHVSNSGLLAGPKPEKHLEPTIRIGVGAATIIGSQDIGQAVVAMGRRVIAVEGLEGTDQMLRRIADLRATNRIDANAQPVLIKIAKPGQELRADMPTIGPDTIAGCQAAGIKLICVSAGSTLIMDVKRSLEIANAAKISLMGIDPQEWV
jgi:UDP-2,3-diacylglucosamine hydrolase